MNKKILIINLCKEKLHYYEFVKPIEDILRNKDIDFYTKHHTKFTDKDLKAEKIIICGTSLFDKDYLNNSDKFKWIKVYNKPILGICAGMQIISNLFKGSTYEKREIGLNEVFFDKEFLGVNGKIEAYQLHELSVKVSDNYFDVFGFSKGDKDIVQAIKYKERPIYGILFHPEVRNKKLVENFCGL